MTAKLTISFNYNLVSFIAYYMATVIFPYSVFV